MPREYTYGPFQSRRLKLSLGVDVLSQNKRCTYNCVYCELGPTEGNQLVSSNFRIKNPPSHHFRKELKMMLNLNPNLSSITFGYNGEPTLNECLLEFLNIASDVREEIKWPQEKPKLTLFTNSSTLSFEDVRNRIKQFELVLAKLDVAIDADFKRTNCPHKDIANIDVIIESLVKMKKEMLKGHRFAIQCLICRSYREDFIANENAENIEQLAYAIKKIKPDIVQVYSIARMPAQYYVFAIDQDKKNEIVKKFNEIINDEKVEVNSY